MNDVFECAWLANVSNEGKAALEKVSRPIRYSEGDVVYTLGAPQHSIWGIERGQVQVHVALNEHEPRLGHLFSSGAWFGETEFLLGWPGIVEMRVAEKAQLHEVSKADFRAVALKYSELWEGIAKLTAMDLGLAMCAGDDLMLRPAKKRIAAVLLRLSGRRGAGQCAAPLSHMTLTQEDIADAANVSRSETSRLLKVFDAEGAIALGYRRIAIKDAVRIEAVLER